MYFGSYRKLVYLAQIPDPDLDVKAADAAVRMGLEYERIETGLGPFSADLSALV